MDFMADNLEKNSPAINFIPCLAWVRRGVAKPIPDRVKLTAEELGAVISQTKQELSELEEEGEEKENCAEESNVNTTEQETTVKVEQGEKTEEDIMAEYGLDNYDEEAEEREGGARLLGLGDLTAFADPREDPYLSTLDKDLGEEDEEDREDWNIRATDNLLLAGHVEGDSSSLEVYVYNDVEDALYIHHDILLPSFPLALEWLSFDPESDTRGSLVAVGSMQPVIEVWDLDLVDSLEPAFRLGQKPSKKKGLKRIGHKDAVLALAWNQQVDHVMASGGADRVVVLWDLSSQAEAGRLPGHGEKVQSLAWQPGQPQSLLSGCCDGIVRLYDCRAAGQGPGGQWQLQGEVERVAWDHFRPELCLASTDQGQVFCLDSRSPGSPLWTLAAHTEAVTGISLSPQCPGCLVTVSQDKALKVWDVSGAAPEFVAERAVKLGALHTVLACPDAPFVFCMGGDKVDDNLKVWDVRESAAVLGRFGPRPLLNPLNTADFGFPTAAAAEPAEGMEEELGALSLKPDPQPTKPSVSGGAISKFKKKGKEKKKKKKEF